MTMGLIYWVLMLIWLVFGIIWAGRFATGQIAQYPPTVNTILLFILFLLLGWKVFGRPVQDL
jgi:hypothetical protein